MNVAWCVLCMHACMMETPPRRSIDEDGDTYLSNDTYLQLLSDEVLDHDDDSTIGPIVTEELFHKESKDYGDLHDLMYHDYHSFHEFQQDVSFEVNWQAGEDDHRREWSDGTEQRHATKKRLDADLPYINYGKGKFGEMVLFPGKDVNYAMVDQRYPVFRHRMMNFYIGSLYGFQDHLNRFTKPQFIGRCYNVNGINSMDPQRYQGLVELDEYGGDHGLKKKQPLAVMKAAQHPRRRYDFNDDCNDVRYWKCEVDDRLQRYLISTCVALTMVWMIL